MAAQTWQDICVTDYPELPNLLGKPNLFTQYLQQNGVMDSETAEVLLRLLHRTQDQPGTARVQFSPSSLLTDLGWPTTDCDRLIEQLNRLSHTTVSATTDQASMQFALILSAIWPDDANWCVEINPSFWRGRA